MVKKCALNRGYALIRGVHLATDQYGILQMYAILHLFNQNGGYILSTLGYNELLQATSDLQVICNSKNGHNKELQTNTVNPV